MGWLTAALVPLLAGTVSCGHREALSGTGAASPSAASSRASVSALPKSIMVPTMPDADAAGSTPVGCGRMTDSILDLGVHGRESPLAAARAAYPFPAGARVETNGVMVHVFVRDTESLTFRTQRGNDGSWLVHALTV